MYIHHFKQGDVITALPIKEYLDRYNRLDTLRVLTEGYEEGEGYSICQKAFKAENKNNGFTGIIRLTFTEKDFLGYLLESDYIDPFERKVIKYYTGIKED